MRSATLLRLLLIVATAVLGGSLSRGSEPRTGTAEPPKAPIEDLIKQLGDKRATVRRWAVKALAGHRKAAVPALIKAAKNGSYRVRIGAMQVLAAIGPGAQDAIPVLIEQLRDKSDYRTTFVAADALGNIGPAAVKAAPDLLRHLHKDWETFLGPHIEPALRKLGPGAAPHVRKALDRKPTVAALVPGENPLVRKARDDEARRRKTEWLVAILGSYGTAHALP